MTKSKNILEEVECIKEAVAVSLEFNIPKKSIVQQNRYLNNATLDVIEVLIDSINNDTAKNLKTEFRKGYVKDNNLEYLKSSIVKAIEEEHQKKGGY